MEVEVADEYFIAVVKCGFCWVLLSLLLLLWMAVVIVVVVTAAGAANAITVVVLVVIIFTCALSLISLIYVHDRAMRATVRCMKSILPMWTIKELTSIDTLEVARIDTNTKQ